MKLKAMAAKMMIRSMPRSIIGRILDNETFTSYANAPVISYGDIGSFRHEDLVETLSKNLAADEKSEVTATNGRRYFVSRTSDGIFICPSEGVCRLTPELAFLAPDAFTRLQMLDQVSRPCWPTLASENRWRTVLAERPLTELELSHLIEDLRDVPSSFLEALNNKWKVGGEFKVSDFFPSSLKYYSSLVGPSPEEHDVAAWIDDALIPNIQESIACSLTSGLTRALAINIDPRLSPSKVLADVPSADLLAALESFSASRSPIALLGILEIALARLGDDEHFRDIALSALDKLIGEKSREPEFDNALRLLSVFSKIGLGKIGVTENLWDRPPFWRRLAAFAHAHMLVETLDTNGADIDGFIAWIDGQETRTEVAASLLDIGRDPIWRVWDLDPSRLRASFVGQVVRIKTLIEEAGLDFPGEELLSAAVEAIKSENRLLDTQRSGPLAKLGRLSDRGEKERLDFSLVSKLFSSVNAELGEDPLGSSWHRLAAFCAFVRFDETLLNDLAKAVRRIVMPNDGENQKHFFETLACAGEVAATQPFLPIADAVAALVIREASKFVDADDVESGYRVLLMSSGAISEEDKRMGWIADQLTGYAFSLPKGEACRHLQANLDALQALLPVRERALGRAKNFVSAASY